jgi:hypothetical protein
VTRVSCATPSYIKRSPFPSHPRMALLHAGLVGMHTLEYGLLAFALPPLDSFTSVLGWPVADSFCGHTCFPLGNPFSRDKATHALLRSRVPRDATTLCLPTPCLLTCNPKPALKVWPHTVLLWGAFRTEGQSSCAQPGEFGYVHWCQFLTLLRSIALGAAARV